MAKIAGKVVKFGHKGYGFIAGNDGQKYFMHQKNICGNAKLRVGNVVEFEPQDSEKGKVAMNISLKNKAKNKTNLTNYVLFISFVLHAITLYAVFVK